MCPSIIPSSILILGFQNNGCSSRSSNVFDCININNPSLKHDQTFIMVRTTLSSIITNSFDLKPRLNNHHVFSLQGPPFVEPQRPALFLRSTFHKKLANFVTKTCLVELNFGEPNPPTPVLLDLSPRSNDLCNFSWHYLNVIA